eukprot:jgi/Undpi1/3844/HiC_scaffold_16.g07213.m1
MAVADKVCLRGLFDKDDDDAHPLVDNSIFMACPAGMRFNTKEECKQFVREHCRVGSNPDYGWMQQIFTTLVSRTYKSYDIICIPSIILQYLEQYLFPRLRDIWQNAPFRKAAPLDANRNVFLHKVGDGVKWPLQGEVLAGVRSRLNLPFHGGSVDPSGRAQRFLSCASTENTLRYLFHHMRCGILVVIRNKKLVVFAPFANKDYTNDWDGALGVKEESLPDYYRKKEENYRKENIIKGIDKWWANGNIICNEHQRPRELHSQYWGDHFVSPLRDLLEQACAERDIADCEFFINKRDYPQLKFNPSSLKPVEPYADSHWSHPASPPPDFDADFPCSASSDPDQDVPLKRHRYPVFTPIVSFYCSERFADIPFPTSEDWEAATGKVFPKTFSHQAIFRTLGVNKEGELTIEEPRDLFTQENFQNFACDWADKQETAFFRWGTATGGGTTRETNQRLALAWLSHEWEGRVGGGGTEGGDSGESSVPLLDAAIVGWNMRDKKVAGESMRFLDPTTVPFKGGRENFTPIYQQSKFKYLVYAEGHCAACRYGFMMRLGSVILKVESRCVADSMWYFPLLEPWVDHVPVKADLSDLEEKIRWCRSHDDECRKMAACAGKIYETFLSHEINRRYRVPPTWWTASACFVDTPPPVMPHLACATCSREGLCTRCKVDAADAATRLKIKIEIDMERDIDLDMDPDLNLGLEGENEAVAEAETARMAACPVYIDTEAAQKQVDTAEEKQRFAGRRREAMKERARAAKEKKQAQGSLW